MQYINKIMSNYLLTPEENDFDKSRTKMKLHKTTLAERGDYDYSSMVVGENVSIKNENPPDRKLHRQLNNTKTLFTALENEIADSKDDIHYLHSQIFSAEEVFPKRWEICNNLKDVCKQQMDIMTIELLKWKRKTERFDNQVKELEQRIGSWQCLIDKAKEVQVRESDCPE